MNAATPLGAWGRSVMSVVLVPGNGNGNGDVNDNGNGNVSGGKARKASPSDFNKRTRLLRCWLVKHKFSKYMYSKVAPQVFKIVAYLGFGILGAGWSHRLGCLDRNTFESGITKFPPHCVCRLLWLFNTLVAPLIRTLPLARSSLAFLRLRGTLARASLA